MTEDEFLEEWNTKMERMRELGKKTLGETTEEEWKEYNGLCLSLSRMLAVKVGLEE